MSIRTIFEFNHDFAHKITDDPEQFVRDLMYYLGSASDENADVLELRYGIRRAWWGHHSDERKVVTKYSEIEL